MVSLSNLIVSHMTVTRRYNESVEKRKKKLWPIVASKEEVSLGNVVVFLHASRALPTLARWSHAYDKQVSEPRA
jgi:hypothetical protein